MDDSDLLQQFVDGSDSAFTELTSRHLPLVYGTALRRTGSADCAADVAQQVFILLAHKARRMTRHTALAGWLCVTTRFVASRTVRAETRRLAREGVFLSMNAAETDASVAADWERLRPVLDDALLALDARDRDAVLLRYLQSRPFTEIGRQLRLTEEAARKRVARAVAKLRAALVRRGIASTDSALCAVLASRAAGVVPPEVSARIARTAWHDARAGATKAAGVKGLTVAKAVLGVVVALATTAGIWLVSLPRTASSLERIPARAQLVVPDWSPLPRLAPSLAGRVAPAAPTDGKVIRIDALANEGQETPEAALATFVWASLEGAPEDIARVICLSGAAKTEADELFSNLPPADQARYRSAEEMMSVFVAQWASRFLLRHGTLRIVSVADSGKDEVVIKAELVAPELMVDGPGWTELRFRRGAAGWQAVMPKTVVDNAKVQLLR